MSIAGIENDTLNQDKFNEERTTDHGQTTGKLYHLRMRVECTFFCNIQSRARTHAVLVIGLYELLGKKGALDSHPQVIKFTSCLPMVGGSFRVLRLLPPLKLVAMI
jgi:hypothetical protein